MKMLLAIKFIVFVLLGFYLLFSIPTWLMSFETSYSQYWLIQQWSYHHPEIKDKYQEFMDDGMISENEFNVIWNMNERLEIPAAKRRLDAIKDELSPGKHNTEI